jgi:hypothetical protein
MRSSHLQIHAIPVEIPTNRDVTLNVRSLSGAQMQWHEVPVLAVEASQPNAASNIFHRHKIAVASLNFNGPAEFRVTYKTTSVQSAVIRPLSRKIEAVIESQRVVTFTLEQPQDVMLEPNGNKWQAIHICVNSIDTKAPTCDTESIWFFGPGLNRGSAYKYVTEGDGVNLNVPSGRSVYLAPGAFITCRLNFINVSDCSVRGHGYIYSPEGGHSHREHSGAIHMSRATNVKVEGVISIGANGFTISSGECRNVHIDRYRAFSSVGNGDGIDFFCSSDILIENCFLRTSDDCIALYSHRWDWYGDSNNITIRDCVLLPDMAHAINVGTHGNPPKPETTSNVRVSNIDILDHEENQVWYQGAIALNAADMNVLRDMLFDGIRVERITRGQVVNIRTMQNAMWTTAPGQRVQNVTIKNLEVTASSSSTVNPSMILGFDKDHPVEDIIFENLKIGNQVIHQDMQKPKWYMVADLVPLFANEHVNRLRFIQST